MQTRRRFLYIGGAAAATLAAGAHWRAIAATPAVNGKPDESFEVTHPDAQWRKLLTPNQYAVLREGGTERP